MKSYDTCQAMTKFLFALLALTLSAALHAEEPVATIAVDGRDNTVCGESCKHGSEREATQKCAAAIRPPSITYLRLGQPSCQSN